ncbi:MAG: hypothetical protein R3E97_06770 [Candidatus Eisenbacteria bacterium]
MASMTWNGPSRRNLLRQAGGGLLGVMIAASVLGIGCGGGADSGSGGAGQGGEGAAQNSDPGHGAADAAHAGSGDHPSAGGGEFVSGQRVDHLIREGETHFKALYQLTNGGENAEAYFSSDESQLILQITGLGHDCDQIYTLPIHGGTPKLVSTGTGRTTCAYFFPGDERILYSSTHLAGPECPPTPDYSRGYVWPLYESYDIFTANPDGSGIQQLTNTPGYDAEATIAPDGTIVFTSSRDGDLEIYTMASDGSNVKRLTHEVGYDGGPFWSQDGARICFRSSHPTEPAALEDYKSLLADGLIRPSQLDIWIMDRDGENKTRLTDNGAANFGPFFHPSGEKIIFASNLADERGRNFDLFLVDIATKEIERITHEDTFDGFPMFSRNHEYLVFASNRGNAKEGETNVFLAEWVD